jgi:hypothetical protein
VKVSKKSTENLSMKCVCVKERARTIVSGSFHKDSASEGYARVARHCLQSPFIDTNPSFLS